MSLSKKNLDLAFSLVLESFYTFDFLDVAELKI